MSLWTPGGEVPVERNKPAAAPEPDPTAGGAAGFTGGPSLADLSPEERAEAEAMIAQMADVQRQISATPAAQRTATADCFDPSWPTSKPSVISRVVATLIMRTPAS